MLMIQSKKYIMMQIKDFKKKHFSTSGFNKFLNNILDVKITAKRLGESISNKGRNKNICNKVRIKSVVRSNSKTLNI